VAELEVSASLGNGVERLTGYRRGHILSNTQKKGKWKFIHMWLSMVKPKITGKQSKKLPKNAKKQPSKNRKNTEYRNVSYMGACCYI